MTVQELIDALNNIEDKTLEVVFLNWDFGFEHIKDITVESPICVLSEITYPSGTN